MDMLRKLDKKYQLRQLYAASDRNPFWRLWWPDTDEDFLWFYQYMVQIDNQSDVGIMTIDVLDYDKARAHALATAIVTQAEKFMNGINEKMQAQTMKFAQTELQSAVKSVQSATDPQQQSVAEMRLTAAQQALAAAQGRPVLTVTDSNTAAEGGGIMQFVIEGGHVRFDIDNAAAARNHLSISSKLLNLAASVKDNG